MKDPKNAPPPNPYAGKTVGELGRLDAKMVADLVRLGNMGIKHKRKGPNVLLIATRRIEVKRRLIKAVLDSFI